MEQGWIKLHRKTLENPIMAKPYYLSLWVTLLLKANHHDKKFMWNNNIMVVKEGQLITGRKELANQTGIPETTIERILSYLEKDHQIGQQKTTKYRLITIVNWKSYQKENNKRTTNGQQTDTNKNDNNNKNDKKKIVASDIPFSLKEEIKKLEDSPRRDMNIIALYFEYRKPNFENYKQYQLALGRHLPSAGKLTDFSDSQIIKAIEYAKKEYPDIYTLETLIKILTK